MVSSTPFPTAGLLDNPAATFRPSTAFNLTFLRFSSEAGGGLRSHDVLFSESSHQKFPAVNCPSEAPTSHPRSSCDHGDLFRPRLRFLPAPMPAFAGMGDVFFLDFPAPTSYALSGWGKIIYQLVRVSRNPLAFESSPGGGFLSPPGASSHSRLNPHFDAGPLCLWDRSRRPADAEPTHAPPGRPTSLRGPTSSSGVEAEEARSANGSVLLRWVW